MIVCSYTLSDYRNSFYGAALAQGSISLTGSTLIRRQHEVTCLEIVWCVWVAYLGGDALTRTHTATRTIHVLAHHATPD